jgi:TonB-linked SusC/RagA family outer membrane protein
LTKSTELIVRLVGTFNEYNGPLTSDASFSTDLYNIAMHTSPVLFAPSYPADEANVNTQHILFGNSPAPGSTGSNAVAYVNPYAALLRGHKNFSQSRLSAQLELNQNLDFLTNGLNFRGLFHTNRYSYFESSMGYSPFYYNIGSYDKPSNKYTLSWLNSQPGQATEYLNYYRDPNATQANTYLFFQGVMDYTKRLGDHNISSSLIATQQQTLYGNTPSLFESLPYRNLTLAGRATYSFKSRYFLEFNFGYNGTERFSANHRFGFFPTIGASWIVSDEKFWGDGLYNIVSRMKVRGSYGTVGYDQIGSQRFFYLSNVNLNGGNPAYFGTNNGYGRNGVQVYSYPNADITWESSKQLNLGLEFTLFKNLNVTAEVYKFNRTNILQTRSSIPSTMGLEADVSANFGEAISKGIDLQMDYKASFGKSGFIQGRGNLTIASSKYSKYEEPEYAESYRYLKGQTLGRAIGYIAERLFVDDNEALNSPTQIFSSNGIAPKGGDIKYRDLNNDGKIDNKDQTFIGYPTVPQIVYGYGISSGYKGFDLSAFFQGQAQVSFFIDPSRTSPFIQSPDGAYASGNTQLLKGIC